MQISKTTIDKPALFSIKARTLLNPQSSGKKTYHVVLDASHLDIDYKVGDSLAVFPENHPLVVEKALAKLGYIGHEKVLCPKTRQEFSLKDFLTKRANLQRASKYLLALAENTSNQEAIDLLPYRLDLDQLPKLFLPLLPRFYSIASAPTYTPGEIHLLVALTAYEIAQEIRLGVASDYLCHRANAVYAYLQPSLKFCLPDCHHTDLIMIGPGTGIAPFKAFVEHRIKHRTEAHHWIFFGERYSQHDFYFASHWDHLSKHCKLQVTPAFSRDTDKKIYVQHKLLEYSALIWDKISSGVYLYICGDAEKMAKDVLITLEQIAMLHGDLDPPAASSYIKQLRKDKRLQLDVY